MVALWRVVSILGLQPLGPLGYCCFGYCYIIASVFGFS